MQARTDTKPVGVLGQLRRRTSEGLDKRNAQIRCSVIRPGLVGRAPLPLRGVAGWSQHNGISSAQQPGGGERPRAGTSRTALAFADDGPNVLGPYTGYCRPTMTKVKCPSLALEMLSESTKFSVQEPVPIEPPFITVA